MAKRKIDEAPAEQTQQDPLAAMIEQFARPAAVEFESTPAPAETKPAADDSILIEVPLALNFPPSEFGVHIDVHLSVSQSTAIRRVAAQLDRRQATLKNGKRVVNVSDAVKYLMEAIAEAGSLVG